MSLINRSVIGYLTRTAPSWLVLFAIFVVVSGTSAQTNVPAQLTTVSIFVDTDSLTIYLPDEGISSLAGLGFEYVAEGQRQTVFLDQYENFAVFRLHQIPTPICLRLEQFNSNTPLPLVCHNVPQVIQVLSSADIFWFDRMIRSTRPLILVRRAEPFKICTSSEVPCVFSFDPLAITPSPSLDVLTTPSPRPTIRSQITLTPQPTFANPDPGSCSNGLSWRLKIGVQGRVPLTETTPSTVRSQPGAPQPIGFIQPGEQFTVMDGPRCTPSNGVSWWFVRADNGTTGWISEGNREVYWIEPS